MKKLLLYVNTVRQREWETYESYTWLWNFIYVVEIFVRATYGSVGRRCEPYDDAVIIKAARRTLYTSTTPKANHANDKKRWPKGDQISSSGLDIAVKIRLIQLLTQVPL